MPKTMPEPQAETRMEFTHLVITVPCGNHSFIYELQADDHREMQRRGFPTILGVVCPTCGAEHDLIGASLQSAVGAAWTAHVALEQPVGSPMAVALTSQQRVQSVVGKENKNKEKEKCPQRPERQRKVPSVTLDS